jgi:hypothetical protein
LNKDGINLGLVDRFDQRLSTGEDSDGTVLAIKRPQGVDKTAVLVDVLVCQKHGKRKTKTKRHKGKPTKADGIDLLVAS